MRQLTEAQMQQAILQTAKQLGYLAYHTTYSIGSERGFPDVVIAGYEKLFVFELKGPRGRVSDVQTAWIETLCEAGVDARIVWPDDLDTVLNDLMAVYQEARAA